MKIGDTEILKYEFTVRRIKLGRINSGAVFLYGKRLWIVLNPIPGSKKFVRTLEGPVHKTRIMKSGTSVYYLESGKSKGMILNEDR